MQPEPVPTSSTRRTRRGIDPRGKAPLDELGDRRARDEHPRIDVEAQSGKPRLTGEVYGRNALLDAPREELVHALDVARAPTRRA